MNKEFFVSTFREWRLYIETFLKWLVIASLIGGAGGLMGAIFHHSIDMAEVFRSTHPWLLWLLPIAGLLIVGFYKMTRTEGLNTNHVIRAVHKGKRLSVLLMPAIFFATVLTQLCGGSAGREGAALQMGGTIGQWIGRGLHLDDSDLRIATLAGMAAFFSALFGMPLAAGSIRCHGNQHRDFISCGTCSVPDCIACGLFSGRSTGRAAGSLCGSGSRSFGDDLLSGRISWNFVCARIHSFLHDDARC